MSASDSPFAASHDQIWYKDGKPVPLFPGQDPVRLGLTKTPYHEEPDLGKAHQMKPLDLRPSPTLERLTNALVDHLNFDIRFVLLALAGSVSAAIHGRVAYTDRFASKPIQRLPSMYIALEAPSGTGKTEVMRELCIGMPKAGYVNPYWDCTYTKDQVKVREDELEAMLETGANYLEAGKLAEELKRMETALRKQAAPVVSDTTPAALRSQLSAWPTSLVVPETASFLQRFGFGASTAKGRAAALTELLDMWDVSDGSVALRINAPREPATPGISLNMLLLGQPNVVRSAMASVGTELGLQQRVVYHCSEAIEVKDGSHNTLKAFEEWSRIIAKLYEVAPRRPLHDIRHIVDASDDSYTWLRTRAKQAIDSSPYKALDPDLVSSFYVKASFNAGRLAVCLRIAETYLSGMQLSDGVVVGVSTMQLAWDLSKASADQLIQDAYRAKVDQAFYVHAKASTILQRPTAATAHPVGVLVDSLRSGSTLDPSLKAYVAALHTIDPTKREIVFIKADSALGYDSFRYAEAPVDVDLIISEALELFIVSVIAMGKTYMECSLPPAVTSRHLAGPQLDESLVKRIDKCPRFVNNKPEAAQIVEAIESYKADAQRSLKDLGYYSSSATRVIAAIEALQERVNAHPGIASDYPKVDRLVVGPHRKAKVALLLVEHDSLTREDVVLT